MASPQRRSRRREARAPASAIQQMEWSQPKWIDAPVEPASEEILEKIHANSLRILEELGNVFLNDEALSILRGLGCKVDEPNKKVYIDRALVEDAIEKSPASFTITPRNRERTITLGDGHFLFGPVSSAPNVSDLEGGRRTGNREDYKNLVRLTQYFNCIHFHGGYQVEPVDLHASTRHLDAIYDQIVLSDKVIQCYSLGTERIEDGMEMVRIAAGLTDAEFESTPHMFTNINTVSPLKHDWPMLDGAMRAVRRGQAVSVSPFTLAGAMAPATVMGALSLQNAEFLSNLVLLQAIRPGAPVIYGAFTSNVDMKSGAPAFGTPEYTRAMQISGQLARRYKLPWRGSNANAANYPDGQSVWESVQSLNAVSGGHCNLVYHGAGWLEGGLCASFEKFIMDCEPLQQMIYLNRPMDVSEDAFAFNAVREVGSGSHFFGAEHTKRRFKDAFYAPFLSDWRNFETWEETGARRIEERANAMMKDILKEFTPPPLDEAINDELQDFIARRKSEGGAPTDF